MAEPFFMIAYLWHSTYYIEVRGDARTGYFIPGCDGIGGWRSLENSSVVVVAVAPKSGSLVKIGILRFLTHSRDLDVLASRPCREFRYGTFLFS